MRIASRARGRTLRAVVLAAMAGCTLRDAGLAGHPCPCADATWICETSRSQCVRACDPGEHACNGACVAEGPSSCGPTCSACPAPVNGDAACVAGACTVGACRPGYLACRGEEDKCCASAVAVATGSTFTCALAAPSAGGQVWCWGANDFKQLGTDALGSSHPRAVAGLPAGILAIAAGTQHACALDRGGALWCWGDAGAGQVGAGPTDPTAAPTPVTLAAAPSTAFTALASSHDYTCAITAASEVACWGTLHGDTADLVTRQAPTRVNLGGAKAAEIAVGLGHACARVGAQIVCWGANGAGELGDGTTKDSVDAPVPVAGITSARALSAGRSHTCAVVDEPPAMGVVRCWGADDSFQLGDASVAGVDPFETKPVLATGVSGAKALAAGEGHTCALFADATLSCWGLNANGALGNASTGGNVLAARVADVAASAASASTHTCVVTPEGRVRCWGLNRNGQLGDLAGPGEFVSVPYDVALR